jgi:O-antigen biosynthesis protein WbqP
MKRFLDLILSVLLLLFFAIPMILIFIFIRITSKGPAFNWSERVSKNNKIFKMPKFRSMLIDTPHVPTRHLNNPNSYLTPIGGFLRRSSLDELPQLFLVLKGDLSLVGPRPVLSCEEDLISLRIKKGVDKLTPGITGWAQVNGRDELSISDKVALDLEYLNHQSIWFDMKILFLTINNVVKGTGISH